ncbi:TBC1 domain family member 20 isoform X3 [Narcine bancroftii]|uniref:TBC1 domain family member 20 isoform X3 n=1 Tax=Narcine bancroftii TaxID=1343680 RepID=UPI003831621B
MSGRRGRKPGANGREAPANGLGAARRGAEVESKKKRKLLTIHQALNNDPVDVRTLRQCAVGEGGLLSDEIRRKVWPKLLNVNVYDLPSKPGKGVREGHKDYNQVVMDVHRSLRRFPHGMRADQRAVLQEQLINVILYVLQRNKQLHYYQGYHDVAVTFLLVVGERMAIALMEILSSHHLRDFMDPTMDSTKHILNYLMPILEQVKPVLHAFMQRLCYTGSRRCSSANVTWQASINFCPGYLPTFRTRGSSLERRSCIPATHPLSLQTKHHFSFTRVLPSARSRTSSSPRRSSALTPSSASCPGRELAWTPAVPGHRLQWVPTNWSRWWCGD